MSVVRFLGGMYADVPVKDGLIVPLAVGRGVIIIVVVVVVVDGVDVTKYCTYMRYDQEKSERL